LAENLQHIPKKDEKLLYKNHEFHVKEASPRRVIQVFISKKNNFESDTPGNLEKKNRNDNS
jgi:CBS domain containing-hemolysin-like protein